MHKISVIIPVYNTERFLSQCLGSVCSQTLKDIQIICIDDGSTDSSPEILDRYAMKDRRVEVYHQNNQRLSAARNNGLSHADGKYVIFWDSDDYFEPDALERLYSQAERKKADICVCKIRRIFERRNLRAFNEKDVFLERIPADNVFNIRTNEKYILNFSNTAVWNKLFRRGFLDEINLRFRTEHIYGEDVFFTYTALCCADRITTVDKALINYRVMVQNSLVSSVNVRPPQTILLPFADLAKELKRRGVFPEQSFANRMIEDIIYILHHFNSIAAQRAFIECLQTEYLEQLGLKHREPGYYYGGWRGEVAEHLVQDDAETFQGFFMHNTYEQLVAESLRLNAKREEIAKLKNTVLYKLFRQLIIKPIRKVRNFLINSK